MAARRDRQFGYEPLDDESQSTELHSIARPMDNSSSSGQYASNDGLQLAPAPDHEGLQLRSPTPRFHEGLQVRSPTPRILQQSAYARPPHPEKQPPRQQQYLLPPLQPAHTASPSASPSLLPQSQRNPYGLRSLEFGLLVALITLIVVGGALGGGLGSSLASQTSKLRAANLAANSDPRATTTITATAAYTASTPAASSLVNYTGLDPSIVTRLSVDCPDLNTNPYTTPRNETFDYKCSWDLPGGSAADTNDTAGGGVVGDLVGLVAYRVEDCLIACSNMNYFQNHTACRAITFWPQLGTSYIQQGANCWLKNASGPGLADANGKVSATIQ